MVVYVRSKGRFSMRQLMVDEPGRIPACGGTTFECDDGIALVLIGLQRQTVYMHHRIR